MTIEEAKIKWLEELKEKEGKTSSIKAYETRLKQLENAGIDKKQLTEITAADFETLISDMMAQGYKAQTIRNTYEAINIFEKWMEGKGMVKKRFLNTIKIPEIEVYEPHILEKEQMQSIMEKAINTDMYLPVWIACTTGIRRSQALALVWDDIDFQRRKIRISRNIIHSKSRTFSMGKERKPREIHMPVELYDVLETVYRMRLNKYSEERIKSEYVCLTVRGKCFEPTYFSRRFRKFVKENDLPDGLRFHDLRWSYINNEVRRRGVKEVAHTVGHHSCVYCLDYYYRIKEA